MTVGTSHQRSKIIRYHSAASTNSIAYDLALRDAPHGTVVVSDIQTDGHGRQSRSFSSPPGGLYLSVILRPHLPVADLSLVTLAAGVASAETLESAAGLRIDLKWPNDLYVKGCKLGGILTEGAPFSRQKGNVPFVVVGIGLNINTRMESFPEELHDLVTSLYFLTNQQFDLDSLLQSLIDNLLAEVYQLEKKKGLVLSRWQARDYLRGKKLLWQDPKGDTVYAKGNGLLPDGRYRLTTVAGEDYPVLAGDIIVLGTDRNTK